MRQLTRLNGQTRTRVTAKAFYFACFRFADGPVIRSRPGNVEADVGSNVTLRCDVDGNPEPEIVWTFESSRRVLSTGAAYTFWMSPDTAGKYICTARVPGFNEISAEAHVLLKGAESCSSRPSTMHDPVNCVH